MSDNRIAIDGERKYRIVPAGDGLVRIVGLLRASEWSKVRKAELFTMRAVHGATLRDETLGGQLPQIGHIFPLALLTADGRSGKAMRQHLTTVSDQQKAGRAAIKVLQGIKASIL